MTEKLYKALQLLEILSDEVTDERYQLEDDNIQDDRYDLLLDVEDDLQNIMDLILDLTTKIEEEA